MYSDKIIYILRILLSIFLAVLIPVYWVNYGPTNFLWFSDIGLFLTVLALWLESPLLISMVCIGVLPIELAWNVDFFLQLITGYSLLGIADYMFDPKLSLFLRALSLFHVVTPIIWIYYLSKWRYDQRAFVYWTAFFWFIEIITYLFTDPKADINWVFIPITHQWQQMHPVLWLLLLMIIFPALIFYPMHLFFTKIYR